MLFSSKVLAEGASGIPALLPRVEDVPKTQATAIDGIWLINTNDKRIRIEAGRAYAVDDWMHLFTLHIQPGMVVIKDIVATEDGQFNGDDLPLLGKWNAKIQANQELSVTVQGAFGPIQYMLIPLLIDQPDWYAKAMILAGHTPPNVLPEPPDVQPDPPSIQPDPPTIQPDPPVDDPVPPEKEIEEKPVAKKEIPARDHGPYACKGKNLYYSKGDCYSCPSGYSRFSPTRKMTHEKACTKRQPGKNLYSKAKYIKKFSLGCPKPQFKHKGKCKSCPNGYISKKTAPEVSTGARFHTGICIAK